jgi:two-component system cell cycle sensor histidine kinase/response regulator CckA
MIKGDVAEDPVILIIDDDEVLLNLTFEVLSRSGHSVIGSNDPQQALELIATTPSLKLLLSDFELGSTTGPALIRQALRDRPGLGVVFMTGNADACRIRKTDTLLLKPLSIAELRTVIDDALHTQPPHFVPREGGQERRRLSV